MNQIKWICQTPNGEKAFDIQKIQSLHTDQIKQEIENSYEQTGGGIRKMMRVHFVHIVNLKERVLQRNQIATKNGQKILPLSTFLINKEEKHARNKIGTPSGKRHKI